ncbi:exodeoxyribonuclease I [Lysobacter sp. SG-8]|uniref:Exodeoxyribonuclease I n=1 Tax=Marilutibacter penaei TaxID=2759900 RepID=A0A7W3U5H7_9GAMM|nr:exodeoxyribonuclease I [Lysobacter penaei]MBB1089233.1 exodeoxyribonuclease I [Lysobacter penaei]
MESSFLFYDLETFGTDPRSSRIAQFAAIRTDEALQPIDEPISFFVRPANDLLPSPGATLVTGITPQQALRDGVTEAEAFARIHEEMARPRTCTLGYNSLRFDDEFIRFGFYRNFHDPYEREWRSGNSRWDLLDVFRLWHALRPEGIEWPKRPDGATSFRLEDLAGINGLREGDAHEALSDVRALIALARRFRVAQPRLWNYALKLRDKRHAASVLDLAAMQPVLHVSQRFPASRLCAAPVLPLARHPHIDNRVIVFDLEQDPEPLLSLDADAIAARLYTPTRDLPEGESRVALKEVHLNRSPVLVAWSHLRPADFDRLGVDPTRVERRADLLRRHAPALAAKLRTVFDGRRDASAVDADGALYDGFIGAGDKRLCAEVRGTPPAQLGSRPFPFEDARLRELLFRYRARNWPDTLSPAEAGRWEAYRASRFGSAGPQGLDAFDAELAALREQHADDPSRLALLGCLEAWRNDIALPVPMAGSDGEDA